MVKEYPKLRFRSYTFPYNPARFEIESQKQVFHTFAPYTGSVVMDLGGRARIIRGEGAFFSDQAFSQYQTLYRVYQNSQDGLLCIPCLDPFYAYFSELSVIGEAGPAILQYSFCFIENTQRALSTTGAGAYTANGRETLWHVAAATGKPVKELLQRNPALAIQTLTEGTEVMLL